MGAKSPSDVRGTSRFASYATRVGRGRRCVGNFIAALANGEMIAEGMNPISGDSQRDRIPSEWLRTGLVLDVRNGDLIEDGRPTGKRTVRWSAIALPAAINQVQKAGKS